jgi:hypothetical protein
MEIKREVVVTESLIIPCKLSQEDAERLKYIAERCGKFTAVWCLRKMFPLGLSDTVAIVDSWNNP